MDKKTENLKGVDELHIKDVGVFFIKDKKAYYADGRPVEPGKLWLCEYCQNSPPFVATKEIDFARHMVEKHPEHAKGETPEAKEAAEKAEAAKKAEANRAAAAKKAKATEKTAAKKVKASAKK